MKRILFIYNRHAGKSKTWASLPAMIDAMAERGCLVTTYPTQYRGDAGDAIVRWGQDYDQVVVAGGDGTLSEAIAGARQLEYPITIGYIPVGTTNDFSRNLDFSSDKLEDLAATAVSGTPQVHDLGSFNGRSFLYVAAFGAFTEVSYSTPQKYKNVLGYNAPPHKAGVWRQRDRGRLPLWHGKQHHFRGSYPPFPAGKPGSV